MLTAIGKLATEQSSGTKTTLENHPDASVRFTASEMVLAIESDASSLSVVKARSRAAGYFYLTNKPTKAADALKANGAIHVLCHIMHRRGQTRCPLSQWQGSVSTAHLS